MRIAWMGATLGLTLLAGCAFGPIDLHGRGCPCAPGFMCIADTCVEESELGMDASMDGGGMDAPGMDAPGVDAPGVDAPGVDAPGIDAPGMDGGTDAPMDAGVDAGHDAGSDAGGDAGSCHVQMLHVVVMNNDGQFEAPPSHVSGLLYGDGMAGELHCGSFSDTGPIYFYNWCYFRFSVMTAIPASARSFSADLTLIESGFVNWDTLPPASQVLHVLAEPVPATAVSDEGDATTRTAAFGTSGGVPWPTPWAASGTATSPDLEPILRSARTSGALVAGASIQLWVRGNDVGDEAFVETPAFMSSMPGVTPTLTLHWCD